jgi:uncharacterized membrane protein
LELIMLPNPLHPALVHFPIVFAVLLPLVAGAALFAIRRGVQPRKAWLAVVMFGVALWVSALVTAKVGEADEERVEEVVAETALERHEEAGERFVLLSGIAVVLLMTGFLGGRAGKVARLIGTGAATALLLAVYSVGHSGGELVYSYGAGRAWTDTSEVVARDTPSAVAGRRHEDQDEH